MKIKIAALFSSLFLCGCQDPGSFQLLLTQEKAIIGGTDVTDPTNPLLKTAFLFRHIYEKEVYIEGEVQTRLSSQRCTASALTRNVLITAAHCVSENAVSLRVELNPGPDVTYIEALSFDIHPALEDEEVDLALVHLKEPLPEDTVLMSLPSADLDDELKEIQALGYGNTSGIPGAVKLDNILRHVQLQIVDPAYTSFSFVVDQEKGKGVCTGDSGGPAFVYQNEKPTLVGVASEVLYYSTEEGNICNYQGVYLDVFKLSPWILKTKAKYELTDKLKDHHSPEQSSESSPETPADPPRELPDDPK